MIVNTSTLISSVKKLLNLCQKRENASMGLGIILKSNDTSVE